MAQPDNVTNPLKDKDHDIVNPVSPEQHDDDKKQDKKIPAGTPQHQ